MGNQSGEEHGSITPYQLTAIAVGSIIGVGVLAFPRLLVEQAGTAAPLAALLGAIPPALSWVAWVKVGRKFPQQTPAEYVTKLIWPPLAWVYALLGMIFVLIITGLTVREFGAVVKTSVLPNTPIEVSISLLLLAAAYFVRYDLQVFARVYEVFLPLMLAPLTLIGLLSLKNARLVYLMPVITDWLGLLKGIAMASVGYIAFVIGPFLLPSLTRPKEAVKSGLWGIGLSLFVYMLAVTASLAVFGPEELKHVIWPTFELVKTTTVPGFILERLESAFLGIWVAAVFTTVGGTYYALVVTIAQFFKLGDHKTLVLPLIPIIYMIAMGPASIHSLYRVVTFFGLIGVGLVQGTGFLFLLLSVIRKKGAQPGATKA
ncbi:MAG TPA: GerAB/ArcD/ProY family transporter [Symbiobacteriaceae bacterium]|nr:GerAB/ArcD/ProY family transporter [Symbiobacteriaceae bacterium]